MNKRINLTIAFLILAATFIQRQLSLLYILTTQSIEICLKDLLYGLTHGEKEAPYDINKPRFCAFTLSGIRRNIVIEELGFGITAATKLTTEIDI